MVIIYSLGYLISLFSCNFVSLTYHTLPFSMLHSSSLWETTTAFSASNKPTGLYSRVGKKMQYLFAQEWLISLTIRIANSETESIAQLVKRWICKHMDLSLSCSRTHKLKSCHNNKKQPPVCVWCIGKQRQSPEANLHGEFHPGNNTAWWKKGGPQPKKTTRGGSLVSTCRNERNTCSTNATSNNTASC